MKRIKRTIIWLLLTVCLLGFVGCGNKEREVKLEFESDGVFWYYFIKKEDGVFGDYGAYSVVGTIDGEVPDMLTVPSYFKGLPVVQSGVYPQNHVGFEWEGEYENYKWIFDKQNIYYPFTCRKFGNFYCICTKNKQFIASGKISDQNLINCLKFAQKTFVASKTFYEKVICYPRAYQLKEPHIAYATYYGRYIQIANTVFRFNYEGSPNDDIFFINDFERGGKIEPTAYEPTREGYTFGGWYKEQECVNAWDFKKDILPTEQYDDERELIFIETNLYAKWIKDREGK